MALGLPPAIIRAWDTPSVTREASPAARRCVLGRLKSGEPHEIGYGL
jgi:hypothetical protein